jgi:hypothetical protein
MLALNSTQYGIVGVVPDNPLIMAAPRDAEANVIGRLDVPEVHSSNTYDDVPQ